jgi:hypothetical protein
MIAVVGSIESCRFRLLGREKPALAFRNREKTKLIFPEEPSHERSNISAGIIKRSTQIS